MLKGLVVAIPMRTLGGPWAVGFACLFAAMVLAYRITPAVLAAYVLFVLAVCVSKPSGKNGLADVSVRPAVGVLEWSVLALLIYALSACVWAPSPWEGLKKVALSAACGLAIWFLWRHLGQADRLQIRSATGLALALTIPAIAVLIIDLMSRGELMRWYLSWSQLVGADQSPTGRINPASWNRNATLVSLLIFPAICLIAQYGFPRTALGRVLVVVGLTLACLFIFLAIKETAKLALIIGCLTFVLAVVSRRAVIYFIAAGWTSLMLLAIPLVNVSSQLELQRSPYIQTSGRARLVIWQAYAERIVERPLFGHGTNAVRTGPRMSTGYNFVSKEQVEVWKEQRGPRYRPVHAHSFPIQIWYELGGLGVVLVWGFGLALIASVASLPMSVFRPAVATLSVGLCTLSLTHSVWQEWFFGAFALAWALLISAHAAGSEPATLMRQTQN